MLPAKHRLTKQKDFERLFADGRGYYTKFLGIKKTANNLEISRFGVIVSNKISKKAVVRNKLKRQIRAIIRKHLNNILSGYDWAVVCLPPVLNLSFEELEKEVLFVLKKLKGLKQLK